MPAKAKSKSARSSARPKPASVKRKPAGSKVTTTRFEKAPEWIKQ